MTLGKLRNSYYLKTYILKLHMCVYFRTKFQVSSIILTSFRPGVKDCGFGHIY